MEESETMPEYPTTRCVLDELKTLDSYQLSNLGIDLQLVLEMGPRIKTVFKRGMGENINMNEAKTRFEERFSDAFNSHSYMKLYRDK